MAKQTSRCAQICQKHIGTNIHSSNVKGIVETVCKLGFKLFRSLGAEIVCRFAIGSWAVEDLAEEAAVKEVIRPTPLVIDEACSSSRAIQQRVFQVYHSSFCVCRAHQYPVCLSL